MRAHLAAKAVCEAQAEAAIAELTAQRYLDDASFARRFAEDRRGLDGWGSERIARSLTQAGVGPREIAAALPAAAAELSAALEVLNARLRRPPTSERERQRALALLVRRGYDLELSYDAVREFERSGA